MLERLRTCCDAHSCCGATLRLSFLLKTTSEERVEKTLTARLLVPAVPAWDLLKFKLEKHASFLENKVWVKSASIYSDGNWPDFLKRIKGAFITSVTGGGVAVHMRAWAKIQTENNGCVSKLGVSLFTHITLEKHWYLSGEELHQDHFYRNKSNTEQHRHRLTYRK